MAVGRLGKRLTKTTWQTAPAGAVVSRASMAAMTGWAPGTHEAVPAAWESADSYLIEAKYDGALALVRCSAATGACNRAVRS